MNFSLDVLYHSGSHYMLVDSKQNKCISFLVAKEPCELAVKLAEVWVIILINNIIASISNDLLIDGEYGMNSRKGNRTWFLDSCVQFVKNFYLDACKMLKANGFVYMYDKFEPNVHYSADMLKIVNKPYLDYCSRNL